MIKIGLYSEDRSLFPLLSSALGRKFQLRLETSEEGIHDLICSAGCDVTILDIISTSTGLRQRLESVSRLIAFPVPAVIMGDSALRTTAFELVRAGAFGYCVRPPSIRDLKTLLTRAYENVLLKRELQSVQGMLEAPAACDLLRGASPRMQRVYELVRRVTNVNASVLVTGESGTGKELIARALHNLGSRAGRPFVAVSCGAIPETLIESELFGHEKGAFTGTVGTREGYFEKAEDGTLFLDEIGELSLPTQVKLLRVLQQMEFSRLGSNRILPLRARLVFATNRDLSKMVADGTFRQDLFYRINVMRIVAPALREHPDDIPVIARHFLSHYSKEFDKPMSGIEPDPMAALQRLPWAGNVRELENVVQRAIILATGRTVQIEDLSLNTREDESSVESEVVEIGDYNPSCSFDRQLRNYKIRLALAAVRENNGNKSLAARCLGISRAYLHRLVKIAESDSSLNLESHDDTFGYIAELRESSDVMLVS
jgi:DNA-binding NtrC family response regulator